MNADEVIQRLCKLQDEVWRQISDGADPADCFCGKGGFWGSTSYGGTFEQGYRNSGKALEFIEQAVREKLRPTQETTADQCMAKVRQHFEERRCSCKVFPGADEFCTAHKSQPCGAPLDADGVDKCERQKGHTGVCGLDPV